MKFVLAVAVAAFGLAGCGAGMSDTTYTIIGGYVFSDAGGSEKTIIYQGDAARKGTVIDARVDRYRTAGNRILVARRPKVQSDGSSGPITTKLSDACEHWVIDTSTHVVSRLDDKSPDALLACNSPYDQEFNPRL